MRIQELTRDELLRLVYGRREEFLERIAAPEGFVVRRFYDPAEIRAWRRRVFELGQRSAPSWHPLYDGCPDYHRLHDDYPRAYVKAKMHAFYFHGWYEANAGLFEYFREIFHLKNFLAGAAADAYLRDVPSDGQVARVNFQNYPVGGGYIAEHVDPASSHALVQTLVQASSWNDDFHSGGLFVRTGDGEKLYLDALTEIGDLLVMTPAIPHGVDPVDAAEDYDWTVDRGKWTVIPIIVGADYDRPGNEKPRQL